MLQNQQQVLSMINQEVMDVGELFSASLADAKENPSTENLQKLGFYANLQVDLMNSMKKG